MVATATSLVGFDPTLDVAPVLASATPARALVEIADRPATFIAAGVSSVCASAAAAMSSGVSDPPHAASEMHSERTLSDMKRGGSGAEVIICGQDKQEDVVSDGRVVRPGVTRASVRWVSKPTVSALRDA